jgi:hypothetical protein
MPGLGWLPPCSQSSRTLRPIVLPPRLAAADEVEQRALELGGAITALRRRGFAWVIARAAGLPLAEVRSLARGYARRVAVELVREARRGLPD